MIMYLVLGWVTACYRCLDSTCSALTQLLQTACEVTNGYISRSELNGTISAGGTGAVMHSIQPHGIDPIIPPKEIFKEVKIVKRTNEKVKRSDCS